MATYKIKRINKRLLTIRFRAPRWAYTLWNRYRPAHRKYPALTRAGWGLLAGLMTFSVVAGVWQLQRDDVRYDLSSPAQVLIGSSSSLFASSLVLDAKQGVYQFNEGYQPGQDVAGEIATPKFSASFDLDPTRGTTVTDPVNKTSIVFKP